MKLARACVIITGGSQGIGLATARAFGRAGARVALAARGAEQLEAAAKSIRERVVECPQVLALPCDVTDGEAVRRTFEEVRRAMGRMDVLVNNAGVSLYGEAEATPVDAVRKVMEVNYFGAVNCIAAVLPVMRKQGSGVIVNVASVAALHGVPFLAAYGATKAALSSYSQSLRAELHGSGIDVATVYPGYAETELFSKEQVFGAVHRPAGPYDSPETVAEAIVEAVRRRRTEVVLSRDGRRLALARRLAPWLVEVAMVRLANALRDGQR